MSGTPDEPVPYDKQVWEQIVADLSDEVPSAPPPPPVIPAPPVAEDPDETYIPPDPPPLPSMDLVTRLAWVGTLGGPLLLFVGVLLPELVGPGIVAVGIVAFVAGFLTLVLRDPHEPEDGWDDGSAV